MTRLLNNLGIGQRIVALAVLPFIAAILFAVVILQNAFYKMHEEQTLKDLLSITPSLSNLVHELQKERGRSASYLDSRGSDQTSLNLETQISETDVAITAYTNAVASLENEEVKEIIQENLNQISETLSLLEENRTRVRNLEVTGTDMASYYTGTITTSFSLTKLLTKTSHDDTISKKMQSLINLALAKEQASRERAVGAAGFSSGTFNTELLDRFLVLIGRQSAYATAYKETATPDLREIYDNTITGPAVDAVIEMREYVIAQRGQVAGGPYSGRDWYNNITEKINLYKQVENNQVDLITNYINDALARETRNAWTLLTALILGSLLLALLVYLTFASVSKPLSKIREAMETIASGNSEFEIPFQNYKSAIGEMARATETFRQNDINRRAAERAAKKAREKAQIQEKERVERETQAAEEEKVRVQKQNESREKRMEVLDTLTTSFNDDLMTALAGLEQSAGELSTAASGLNLTADQAESEITSVSKLAEGTNSNMQNVASATEELSASIAEISRQVTESTHSTEQAVKETEGAGTAVEKLTTSSNAIGEMLVLINDIANQTNLLALNATIEAARAGDAGKGFAVVAQEVKALANQTAKATGEIEDLVQNMRGASQDVENAVKRIGDTINKTSEVVTAISSAVEEQGAATKEISKSVQQASGDTTSVSSSAQSMREGAESTKQAATTVQNSSAQMSSHSQSIREVAQQFFQDIQEA